MKQRYVVNLEFDGFFVDDDLSITFDGKTSASFYKVGTRDTPCVVEVYAKSALTNYTITGLGEDDIIIESLAARKDGCDRCKDRTCDNRRGKCIRQGEHVDVSGIKDWRNSTHILQHKGESDYQIHAYVDLGGESIADF